MLTLAQETSMNLSPLNRIAFVIASAGMAILTIALFAAHHGRAAFACAF
jgi:hypothetical protein